jgi:hypothetical protein
MRGNARRSRYNDAEPASVASRLDVVLSGAGRSNQGPTAMHREQYDLARASYREVRSELDRILDGDLPTLERALDAADVPWTTGRPLR